MRDGLGCVGSGGDRVSSLPVNSAPWIQVESGYHVWRAEEDTRYLAHLDGTTDEKRESSVLRDNRADLLSWIRRADS